MCELLGVLEEREGSRVPDVVGEVVPDAYRSAREKGRKLGVCGERFGV